jgi:hypothetical protein
MLIFTVSVYLSALVMVPAVCFTLWMATRKFNWRLYSIANLFGFATILLAPGWYISTLFRLNFWGNNHNAGVPFVSGIPDFSKQLLGNFSFVVQKLLPFFPQSPAREWWYVCSAVLILLTLYYSIQRKTILFLLGVLLSGLGILSLSHISVSTRYIIPFVFPAVLFLAGELVELGIIARFRLVSFMFLLLFIFLSGKIWIEPQS